MPALHRRQPRHAEESDERLTRDAQYEKEEQQPKNRGPSLIRGGHFGLLLRKIHALVVPVPLALVELVRVVLALELEEVLHLREAGLDLALQRVAVIGRVVAAAVAQADVDQAPQGVA